MAMVVGMKDSLWSCDSFATLYIAKNIRDLIFQYLYEDDAVTMQEANQISFKDLFSSSSYKYNVESLLTCIPWKNFGHGTKSRK